MHLALETPCRDTWHMDENTPGARVRALRLRLGLSRDLADLDAYISQRVSLDDAVRGSQLEREPRNTPEPEVPTIRGTSVATFDRALADAARAWLRGASRLRRMGRPVTAATLAWASAARDDDENAEGLAELAALGGSPPTAPVTVPTKK